MRLYCPHCGVKGVTDDSYRGKKLKCPKCLGTFVAEETAAAAGTEPEETLSAATEDGAAAEGQAPGGEEEGSSEPEAPATEAISAKEMSVEEVIEAEPPPEPAPEPESVEIEEPVKEEAAAVRPPEAEPEEEEESALDWDEIAAEVEAKAAEGERDEEGEELPADLFAGMTEEEEAELAAQEDERPEAEVTEAEVLARGDRSVDWEPQPEFAGEAELEEESPAEVEVPAEAAPAQPSAEAESQAEARAETEREDYFIFEEREAEPEPGPEVEDQPYGMTKEQCWQCGRKNRSAVPYVARSGRLYCPECLPVAEPEEESEPEGVPEPPEAEEAVPQPAAGEQPSRFTVGRALREAWRETRGAKGPIWAGSAIMYLVLIVLAAGGSLLLPGLSGETAPDIGTTGKIAKVAFETLFDAVSMLFSAGLVYMGIRKVSGDPVSWKMIFSGFSSTGKIIVAGILQSLLIFLGFLVLVLPGIYLAVGYSMTIPLIVDRKMSPWQAMETSRKAVHRAWWRVAGLYFVMGLLFLVSMVPLGIGLIWTWPMFVILAGVVYRSLLVSEK